jgi:hypothetical protein
MLRKYGLTFAVIGLVVSVVAGLMLTSDAQMWAATGSVLFLLFIPASSPRIAGELAERRRLLLALGIGVAVLAIGSMVAGIALWPETYNDRATAFSVWGLLAGGAIGYLPFMSSRVNQAWADLETMRKNPPTVVPAARAKGDLQETLRLLIRERSAVAWTIGPWFVMYCVLPTALLAMMRLDLHSKAIAGAMLLSMTAFLLVLFCLPLIASIRWARYLATDVKKPLFDIPLGALWGVLWRLFFAGMVFRIVNGAEPWLKSQLPGAEPWLLSALAGVVSLFVLVLVSPWAMVFIAVALDAPDRSMRSALRTARSTGRGIYLGMLLILAPSIFLFWLTGLAPTGRDMSAASWLAYLAFALIYFLTLVVATTYLTGIYLRSPTNSAASTPA